MIRTLHYHLYLNLFFICYRPYYNSLTDTEMWFWRNIRHWLQRKSSLCQLPVHPMTKMSSIWALNVVLCDNVSGCYYWYGIYCWRNDVKTWIKYPIFNFSSSVQRFIQRDFSSDIFAYVCNTLYMDTLIHWGRATHIRVMKLIIIGSDNGLSPSRRQSIIWTSAGILLIGHWGTNFNEIFTIIQQFWSTHWGRVTHTGKKYWSIFTYFYSRKFIWKCRLDINGDHSISVSVGYVWSDNNMPISLLWFNPQELE